MASGLNNLAARRDPARVLDIRQYLSLQLDRSLAEVNGDARLVEDLGMDSLELADVLVMLETRHGISLSMDAIQRLDTVEALLREACTCHALHD